MSVKDDFPAAALQRLAEHIAGGDVVFFVGAGFSLDTEKNAAWRLVTRLLLRLLAFAKVFRAEEIADLVGELKDTFGVGRSVAEASAPFPFSEADVAKLATRYYETNEWFCAAFAAFVEVVASDPAIQLPQQAIDVANAERQIHDAPGRNRDPLGVPLQSTEDVVKHLSALLVWIRAWIQVPDELPLAERYRAAGKALFLDTLGFRDCRIMGGDPSHPRARDVAAAYSGRLLPRHHVLARLAREGLCTTTLTANYDLLLEGAFRLAGFELQGAAERPPEPAEAHDGSCDFFPATTFAGFARIASPPEFFSEGKAHRTPVLVKVHGCVDRYRACKYDSTSRLVEYLPSIVFTYREIQNWRGDSWAADFLRTLLRTRTVVFVGYSLQDPVIHDTFRTVYEEMAREMPHGRRHRGHASAPPTKKPEPQNAPAFFFAPGQESREFYGLEVLQAASGAVGEPRAKGDHPNYVRFHLRDTGKFPDLDEVFVWLQHAVKRRQQSTCLEAHLRRMMAMVLGGPRVSEELDAVRRAFADRCGSERTAAMAWRGAGLARGRHEHGRITGWTDDFHPGLLRQFAAVDLLHHHGGPSTAFAASRHTDWYYPSSQDAVWTCWALVVEIAARRMIRAALCVPEGVPDHRFMGSARATVPTILFGEPGEAPGALAIYLAGFDPESHVHRIDGLVVRHCAWQLTSSDSPWRRSAGTAALSDGPRRPQRRVALAAPPADEIWRWASAPAETLDPEHARAWLGMPTRSNRGHSIAEMP